MAMPSDPVAHTDEAVPVDERRLHPLSWIFVLLQQLRSFAIPLIVLVVTGRGGPALLAPLVGVGGLVVVSVIR
jgi:putative membrane protein